jgi:hypothetical protein
MTPEPRGWRHIRSPKDGPGVCICPISYPGPDGPPNLSGKGKCCAVCGFPCVHRLAPHIRTLALTKMPVLARQVIDRGVRSVA